MPTKLRYKPSHTPYEFAVITNLVEMCKLFEHYGVNRVSVADFKGEESLLAACFRMDRDEVSAQMKAHPEFLQSPEVIYAAAQRDRADVVALLLGLGIPIEITNKTNKRAIHEAAAHNALRVARLLVERGVEIGPIETTWDTTPIGWAAHADHVEMVAYLSEFTRDIWTLSFWGYVDRLREVLHQDPSLARLVDSEGITPLWWLPDDEAKALAIVELLIAHGADPSHKNNNGRTAADWASTRGMLEVAEVLRNRS
ncbi:MAG TPA: ankyrin repeat domain-containing protein [Pyrinomonadaceae bacterium]|jgi:ankyrin repeat protein|nr:ankyrin repeat domain-containing protein [Pyrinomonadaceae bacterium]